ncbi:MAG: tetratricopeptide repeat protein [Proteobacteria bacterium]|nr:tetratricopeptide repeat protein [Pseudomonadota bacterium]
MSQTHDHELPSSPSTESAAHQLLTQAFAWLDRNDIERAARIAEQLSLMRHSGAFEVWAEVHRARGDHAKAIEVLEEGVQAAPKVWLLWQSLGNAYTMGGRHEDAQRAFGRALGCPSADASSIHFNRGMAFARHRRFEEALEAFGLVSSPLLQFQAASFELAILNDLHRFDQAVEKGRALLSQDASEPQDRARVHGQLARAYLQGYDDRESSRRHVDVALKIWAGEPTARAMRDSLERIGPKPSSDEGAAPQESGA